MAEDKILIYDQNKSVLDLTVLCMDSYFGLDVLETNDAQECLKHAQWSSNIFLFIIDARIADSLLDIAKHSVKENQKIPIFVTHLDRELSAEEKELIEEVIDLKNPLVDIRQKMEKYFKNASSSKKKEYAKINMRTLIKLEGLEDDVYVCLKTGRFLKLFSKADKVNEEDIKKYEEKGIEHLYVLRNVGNWILSEVNKDFENKIQALDEGGLRLDSSTKEQEVEELENSDNKEEVLKKLGLDQEFMDKVLEVTNNMIKKIKKNPALKEALKNLSVNREESKYFNNHVQLLCTISSGLAKETYFTTEGTMEKLVFCSYMHDLSLTKSPKLAQINTLEELDLIKDTLSKDDIELFLNHPEDAVKLLSTLSEVPPDSETIIRQHHETASGTGFPDKVDHKRISPLSALFIISHDLVDYIIANKDWTIANFLKDHSEIYKGPTFRKVLDGLNKLKK